MDKQCRKQLRLKDYDYSQNGAYFVTICTHDRECLLGEIVNGQMKLNQYGNVVNHNVEILSNLYDDISVEKYIIMPNHVHLILLICRERIVCVPSGEHVKLDVPKIIQIFKSSVSKGIHAEQRDKNAYNAFTTVVKVWQKSYHDRIIRNEAEYQKFWEYIETNPLKWELDKYYKEL